MNPKILRYFIFGSMLFVILSFFSPLFPDNQIMQQLHLSHSTAFGLSLLCIFWFIYFSGYRYARQLLLVFGITSLVSATWLLIGNALGMNLPFQQFILPNNEPFLVNLNCMFIGGYIIQILYYWFPRTKFLINITLGIIFFLALLSIFGHIYSIDNINPQGILFPMPFGGILSFLALMLVIFAHVNHMKRFFLNRKIILSFAVMLVAICLSNVVIHTNFDHSVSVTRQRVQIRKILTDVYNIELYLHSTHISAHLFRATGDASYRADYDNNKQAYMTSMAHLKDSYTKGPVDANTKDSIVNEERLGSSILALVDGEIAQLDTQASTSNGLASEKLIDGYMNQLVDETKTINSSYTKQLNQLTSQDNVSVRGTILGVSITSALSLMFIIFAPLFIREAIQQLSVVKDHLRRSNRLLREEKSKDEAILSSMADGLFVVDTAGIITIFNDAAEVISGQRRAAVLGRDYSEVLHFSSPANITEKTLNFVTNALKGTSSHLPRGVKLQSSNGKMIDVDVSVSPVPDVTGTAVGAVIVFRDRSSEQALENAKDEFVAIASHQLRTPATATKQYLAMFLQGYAGTIDQKQRQFLQEAYNSNETGINIIEDLLNVTRIESDRFKIATEKIELNDFLSKVTERHKVLSKQSKQSIRLVTPAGPVYIDLDPSLLTMAVDNLITNALKYSDAGDTVTVTLSNGERVKIAVRDEGIGIKKQDIPKIFERFTRLEDSQKQYVVGTGIGLYLIQKITKIMHATVHVESDYGKGSTFTLEFKQAHKP